MRTVRRVLAIVAVPIVVIAAVALVRLDGWVRAYLAGPALGAVRIYAAPTMLRRGAPVPGGSLARKLARLGYRQAEGGALVAGTYRAAGGGVDIAPRPSAARSTPEPIPRRPCAGPPCSPPRIDASSTIPASTRRPSRAPCSRTCARE